MQRIAAESGPEAVAFAVTTSSGTAISDAGPWVNRLINSFGSPNNCNAYEICSWHRDFATAFTTGGPMGIPVSTSGPAACCCGATIRAPRCSLPPVRPPTRAHAAPSLGSGVDPRRVGLAVKADQWLRVRPGDRWRAGVLSIAGEK